MKNMLRWSISSIRPSPTVSARGQCIRILSSLVCLLLLAAWPVHAETPGDALRSYLTARLQGDLETASGLWERLEMRRARAMGMRYADVEASYDNYWMMSAAERQEFAQQHRLVLRDSSMQEATTTHPETAHFTVEVQSQQGKKTDDVWRYLVQKTDAGWRVSLPLRHDSRSWTQRESRYVDLRSKRLARVNTEALHTMDRQVDSLFTRFGTPKAAQLRLERVKIEIFLAESAQDVEELLGDVSRMGYLPGAERIVTLQVADMAALTTAVANLTLRRTPPVGAPFMEHGLALASGGSEGLSADVYIQRMRNRLLRGELDLGEAFSLSDDDDVRAAQALWNRALLDLLGHQAYFELYADLRGTPRSMQHLDPGQVRQAIEKATGKKDRVLENTIVDVLRGVEGRVQSGCERWPADVRNLRPLLTWRDPESTWSMRGYEVGQQYVFAVGAFRQGLSRWEYDYADSLSRASSGAGLDIERSPDPERPAGDPPYIVVTLSPRYDEEPEPYVSRVYEKLFTTREYRNELLGFFVTYDLVRVYDYRTERLIAEYSTETAPPDDVPLYDEDPGRMCFRIDKSVFGRPLVEFTPRAERYTGE
jgi:hypothetical protein